MIKIFKNTSNSRKGFTIVELLVSLAIFVFMTAFLLAKYGTFNQGEILTNLAYDVALTVRNAQQYGLDVKSAPGATVNYSNVFTYAYGVHFDTSAGNNGSIILFEDSYPATPNGLYDAGNDPIVSTYTVQNRSIVSGICVGTGPGIGCTSQTLLDMTFKRPNPDAVIMGSTISGTYAEITLQSSDGTTKKVIVRSTGQISISN